MSIQTQWRLVNYSLHKANNFLRAGQTSAAFTELSQVPPELLVVYTDYVAWADLALQAYVLTGRHEEMEGDLIAYGTACNVTSIHDLPANTLSIWALLLHKEGSNVAMLALLERWISNVYDKAMGASSSSTHSVGPYPPTPTHLPSHSSSDVAAASSASYFESGSTSGMDRCAASDQPQPPNSPWRMHTTLADVRGPLNVPEMEALARLYIETCLCGCFDAYEIAARWLDGPQGGMLLPHEPTHSELFDAMVERMPGGAAFAADLDRRREHYAQLHNITPPRSTLRVFGKFARRAEAAAFEGRVLDRLNMSLPAASAAAPAATAAAAVAAAAAKAAAKAQATAITPTAPAQLTTVAASFLAPLKPLLQSLTFPVNRVDKWLTAVQGAVLTTAPSKLQSASATGYSNTVVSPVDGSLYSLSDAAGNSSSNVAQENLRQLPAPCKNSRRATSATSRPDMPPQANSDSAGGESGLEVAGRVVATALAAWMIIDTLRKLFLKTERRSIWAAAKRLMAKRTQ